MKEPKTWVPDEDLIERALERLEETGVSMLVTANDHKSFTKADVRKPLAALIREAAEPVPSAVNSRGYCHFCNSLPLPNHAPDCALIALCRAIAGEGA